MVYYDIMRTSMLDGIYCKWEKSWEQHRTNWRSFPCHVRLPKGNRAPKMLPTRLPVREMG